MILGRTSLLSSRVALSSAVRIVLSCTSNRMSSTLTLPKQGYINGSWVDAQSGKTFDVISPIDQKVMAQVPDMGLVDTQKAIAAAKAAFPAWRRKTNKERSILLRHWNNTILEHQEQLAELVAMEMGKPLAEARGEVVYAANFVEWFAEEAKRIYGDIIPGPAPGKRIHVTKQPIGVCALITPWNFPIGMGARKIAPALAAGCTVILKPSEEAPLCSLYMAALAEKSGIPPGVINVVTGSRDSSQEIGLELTTNTDVAKVSFTGSTKVGKILLKQGASTLKRVTLELGGNAPFIVCDDADLELALKGVMASKFRNTGQTCVCANRIYVQEGVYAQFKDMLVSAVKKLKVGNPLDLDTTQGPLVNEGGLRKVKEHVEDAVAKGAKVMIGGKPHPFGPLYYQPTVLCDVTGAMLVTKQETFGPVAPLIEFKTVYEAVQLANKVNVGLAGYVYTRDLDQAHYVSEALEVGMVGVNDGIVSTEVAPFGGWKESGLGREGSKYGMDAYLEVKYTSFGGMRAH